MVAQVVVVRSEVCSRGYIKSVSAILTVQMLAGSNLFEMSWYGHSLKGPWGSMCYWVSTLIWSSVHMHRNGDVGKDWVCKWSVSHVEIGILSLQMILRICSYCLGKFSWCFVLVS